MIDKATIDKIMDAARIEDVVSDFVTLKKAGANYKGLCPFHDDRTPSFMVSPAKNYCKCFACGKGGNPVGFIMEHEQLTYPEALRWLAKKYGITIEEKELTQEQLEAQTDRESMYILNNWAQEWFTTQLYETNEGRDIGLAYFRSRGFRDDIIKKFHLGYCPNNRNASLSADALKAGYKERYLLNDVNTGIGTGLGIKRENSEEIRDRFWGRVIWPIYTISGKIAGFGGRVLSKATKGVNVKYLNSPDSLIYSKKQEPYGLYQAKKAINQNDMVYMVEGYTDVMAMHQAGIENVVASSGTALTDEQIRKIHRFTDNIVIIYDGDEAGQKASKRGIDMLLAQGMNVKLLLLPEGKDPDEFSREQSAQDFKKYLEENQIDFIKFKTQLALEKSQGDPIKLSELVTDLANSIANVQNEITRSFYIRETANMMQMEERLIANAVNKAMTKKWEEAQKQRERNRAKQGMTAPTPIPQNDAPLPSQAGNNTPQPEDIPMPPPPETATGITDDTETATSTTPHQNTAVRKIDMLLYKSEVEVMQVLIRYGEQVLCNVEDEEGNTVPITVAEYIYMNLHDDKIFMRTDLHNQLITECMEHIHDKNFVAERYFINHSNPTMSNIAYELSSDREQLSKIHNNASSNGTNTIERTKHVLTNFKLKIIEKEILELQEQMRNPEIQKDANKCREILVRFKEVNEIKNRLAHECGDRVFMR